MVIRETHKPKQAQKRKTLFLSNPPQQYSKEVHLMMQLPFKPQQALFLPHYEVKRPPAPFAL